MANCLPCRCSDSHSVSKQRRDHHHRISLAMMAYSLPRLMLLVLLIISGVAGPPVEPTETPEGTEITLVMDNKPSNLTSGCSDMSSSPTNVTESTSSAESIESDNKGDEDEEEREMVKKAEALTSTESATIATTLIELINNDDDENIASVTTMGESVDQTETLEFRHNVVGLTVSATEFPTTLNEQGLTEASSLTESDDLDPERPEETDSEDGENNFASETFSSIPVKIPTSSEETEGRENVDHTENILTEIPKIPIEKDLTTTSPKDKASTIREISIILLPLEEREEYDSDTDVEKIVSLFEIGGDSYETGELKNSSQFEATNTVNALDFDPATEGSVAFNAAKMREKMRTSSKATSTTTAETTTTTAPITSSSTLETTTTTSRPSTLTTTIISTTPEDLQTETTTDETTLVTLEGNTETLDEMIPCTTNTPDDISTTMTTTTTLSASDKYNLIDDSRYISGNVTDMVAAVQFLHYHDKASSEQCYKLVNAHWNYATNLTEENKKKQLAQTLEYSQFHKEAWKNATAFAWKGFKDVLLRRWFKSLSVLGTAALSDETLTEFNKLKAEMKNIYSTAKVCGFRISPEPDRRRRACSLSLEPDLQRIMTKSRDYDELVHVWKSWRDTAGKPIRQKYLKFVEISNKAAHLNGFRDTGDMWRESYESVTFREDLAKLWEQLRPLYEHLHAFVRRRLITLYGNDRIKEDGPIPAHLFGNMWAQSWVSLMDISQPYPGKPSVDVTSTMEMKNMTALEMFKISEEFFTSLGLKAMPEEFWKHSLIEKPRDREIICHASAWDFCNGKDYRIKQCTDITMEDLITVHHEMGHIQYFLQYARQPNVFREGANPGFHEAIGDVLALSVSTPNHLKSIGLLQEVSDDPEGDLNFLYRIALEKVSFLPSGYLIDLWRWGLFSEEFKAEEMNTKWWELRLKYQGICPPIKRSESDFDPGAKYHVPGNVPYIRYFVSFVIQFQFHKVLCDASGHVGPLHKCDVYRSKEAGQILSQVMELGSSEHWSEAMKIMTGGATSKMDASPILEYFEPLLKYLIEQNRNETIGWKSSDPTICP